MIGEQPEKIESAPGEQDDVQDAESEVPEKRMSADNQVVLEYFNREIIYERGHTRESDKGGKKFGEELQSARLSRIKTMQSDLGRFNRQVEEGGEIDKEKAALDLAPALSALAGFRVNVDVQSTSADDAEKKQHYEQEGQKIEHAQRTAYDNLYGESVEEIPETGDDASFASAVQEKLAGVDATLQSIHLEDSPVNLSDEQRRRVPGDGLYVPLTEERDRHAYDGIADAGQRRAVGRQITEKAIAELGEKDPEYLLELADMNLHDIGGRMSARNWREHNSSTEQSGVQNLSEEGRNELEQANRAYYELMCVRDALRKRLYGQEDISPDDREKMRKARERLEDAA